MPMFNVAARLQSPSSVGNQPKFWSAMITQDEYHTITAWEYAIPTVDPNWTYSPRMRTRGTQSLRTY